VSPLHVTEVLTVTGPLMTTLSVVAGTPPGLAVQVEEDDQSPPVVVEVCVSAKTKEMSRKKVIITNM